MKVDKATAVVAKIAIKTLKPLCMISVRWLQREATRFHFASMRALMALIRDSCAVQYARLAAVVP